jgi:DNA-binding MarR family transcriptional regulator
MDMDSETLAAQVLQIINRLTFHERKQVFPHGDLKLYPSEIHLMLLIDDEPNANATEMAERLGVTKGAISQTLSRLEKKGVIQKTKDAYHKNELTASFTPLGQEALGQYRELRTSLQAHYVRYFSALSPDDRAVIGRFLSHMEAILDHRR